MTNVVGKVQKVTVTFNGLTHGYANDIGAMLVGPNGEKVGLIGNAGGGQSLNNVTFTLADGATALPQFAAIVSGQTYAPADYSSPALTFPTIGGYDSTSLGTFVGNGSKSPLGWWNLYLQDVQPLYDGSLSSWTLNLWLTPQISTATNTLWVAENSTGTLSYTVHSDSATPDKLTVWAKSDNTALLANTNVVASAPGADGTGTITVTPILNQYGTNTITLYVTDGVSTNSLQRNLYVTFVDQAPTFTSQSTNRVFTSAGKMTAPVTVKVADVDNAPAQLTLSAQSDAPSVVAPTGFFSTTDSTDATGKTRLVTVVPQGSGTGVANLTIWVSDGVKSNSIPLQVTVNPVTQPQYANTAAMVPDNTGTVSKSITVPNTFSGLIGKVVVSVSGVQSLTAGSSLVLTPPHGGPVTLLAAGPTPASNYGELTFVAGGGTLPNNDDLTHNLQIGAGLDALAYLDPKGTWTLTLSGAGEATQITGGFLVTIFTAPTISSIPNISMPEETSTTVNFTVGDMDGSVTNVLATVLGTPSDLISPTQGVISGNNVSLTVTGNFNRFGTNTVQVVAKDNSGFTATNTFNLAISFVDHAPTISFIEKQVTTAGVPVLGVPFTIGDVDSPISALSLSVSSDNTKLLPIDNIQIQGTGANRTLSLFPLPNAPSPTATVTITVTDEYSKSGSSTFVLYVQPAGNPLYTSSGGLIINSFTGGAAGMATPYPSVITIPAGTLVGTVEKVQLALYNVSYPGPAQDLSVLLVGPNTNNNVVLMGKVGGSKALNDVTLIFDDNGTSLFTDPQLLSGLYKPTSVATGDFGTNAPPAPYGSALSVFNGTNPNGTWKLYVFDDSTSKGTIGSWSLSIQTAPAIANIGDQTTSENKTKNVTISIGDNQPGVNVNVTATIVSDPLDLVDSVTVSGTGSTRTLAIKPTAYHFGTNATIQVTANDGVNSSQKSFNFSVSYAAQPPVLAAAISDKTTDAATPLTAFNFTIWNPQSGQVNVVARSGDQTLVPDSNITVTRQSFTTDGTNTFSLSLIPLGVQSGTTTIYLDATDAVASQTATFSFKLTVNPILAFANTSAISIPQGLPVAGTATPYPASINVGRLDGVVSDVKVALVGLTHPYPRDLDILLVSPDPSAKPIMLMAHAGDASAANNLRITFTTDQSAPVIPQSGTLASTTYRPADYSSGVTLPTPAPARPYSSDLRDLKGSSPNGTWQLYVLDDTYPDGGSISGGWILYLTTGPQFANIGPQSVNENGQLVIPLTIYDTSTPSTNLTVTAGVSGNSPSGLVAQSGLTVVNKATNQSLTITPTQDYPSKIYLSTVKNGTNLITLTATDGSGYSSTVSFPLTVNYINQMPGVIGDTNATTITTNGIVYMDESYPGHLTSTNITYDIYDVDSTLYTSNIVVTSSDQTIVANSNVVMIAGSNLSPDTAGQVVFRATPTLYAHGSTVLTVSVADGNGNIKTAALTLTVNHIWQAPTISSIPAGQTATAGGSTTNIQFTVDSVEIPARDLLVYGKSSNQSIAPDQNIVVTTLGNNLRAVQVTTIGTVAGSANITLFVTDLTATNSTTFTLAVGQAPVTKFANTMPIQTTAQGKASPYSTTNHVTGMSGAVYKISVLLDGFTMQSPADLDVLLVQRRASKTNAVMLMSGAGGTAAVSNFRLNFADGGATLPTDSLSSGTYQPQSYTRSQLPSPAPTNITYSATLSAFNGTDPNGDWELYVYNRGGGAIGTIGAGWTLSITTGPTIQLAAGTPSPLVIPGNTTSAVNLTVGDMFTSDLTKLVVSATSTNTALLPVRNITFTGPNSGGNVIATLAPSFYQSGSSLVTFTVQRPSDLNASASTTLQVSVTPSNTPPSITRIDNQIIGMNNQGQVSFVISDPDTAMSRLILSATSGNTTVIPNSGLLLNNSGTNVVNGLTESSPQNSLNILTIVPAKFASGNNIPITLAIIDPASAGTNTVLATFNVTVQPITYAPILSSIPEQSVAAGSALNIPFTVVDPNSPALAVTVTGTSSDQNYVKDASIVATQVAGSTTNWTLHVQSESGTTQTNDILITLVAANAGGKSATNAFTLHVRAPRVTNFANRTPITINDYAAATPYPSTIAVSGLVGPISKLSATLNGFTHSYPSDVGVLLVSPDGKKIVLMNKAGGGGGAQAVAGLTLTFDDTASTVIPQGQALVSGIYKPHDYKTGTYNFPTGAPTNPYTNSLTQLNGIVPNGTWSLYVVDDTQGDAGAITNGWSLGVTTLPVINGLADITNANNVTTSEAFTISDDVSSPTYTFSGHSDNQGVVADSGITFSGSGSAWTVNVTPVQYATGSAKITVNGLDADGQTFSASFKLTIQQVNTAPTIAAVAPQPMSAGTVLSVPLNYSDAETAVGQLKLTFASDNPQLVGTANLKQSGTNLLIAPRGAEFGTANITVMVTDAGNLSATTTFALQVLPNEKAFANTNSIAINYHAATPYPSTVTVAGLGGSIASLTATLDGFQHTFPSDVSVLLVGPNGQTVVLMSAVGGGVPVTNARLTFDDASSNVLPQYGLITDGTYDPTDYSVTDTFGTPAPQPPYGHSLSVFNGTNPNGTWSLYVWDAQVPDNGLITGGWHLTIATSGPMISQVPAQTTPENVRLTVPFTVSSPTTDASNLVTTVSSANESLPGLLSSLVLSGTGANRTLVITPGANLPSLVTNVDGTATITLTVTDGTLTNSVIFPLTVKYVEQAPVVSGLMDTNTPANQSVAITFSMTDVDSAVDNLSASVVVSNPDMVDAAVSGTPSKETVTLTPKNQTGSVVVSVLATDGIATSTNSFTLTLDAGLPPVIVGLAPSYSISQDTSLSTPFTVQYGTPTMTLAVTSDNTNLVADASAVSTATNVIFTVTPAAGKTGTANLTVYARTEWGIATSAVVLTVGVGTQPPVLSPIADQTGKANQPIVIPLTVSDADTALSNLVFSSSNNNPALVSGVTFTTLDGQVYASVNLVANQGGQATVTITVTDGTTPVSQSFKVTVAAPPVLGAIADQTTSVNKAVVIPLTVSDADTALTNLVFSSTNSNSALVSGVTFTILDNTAYAVVNLVTNQSGVANISISVTDGTSKASQSFKLTVTAPSAPVTVGISVQNGKVTLSFKGTPGGSYAIQSSTDLKTFTEVATVQADSNGNVSYQTDVTSGAKAVFYRTMAK